jgi:hypothetical protein
MLTTQVRRGMSFRDRLHLGDRDIVWHAWSVFAAGRLHFSAHETVGIASPALPT